jgi:hypothetical protein
MGASSCATIAVGGFKDGQYEANEKYKKDKVFEKPSEGYSVSEFYSKIIYPTSQPLGKTYEMPFEKLMKELQASPLKTKFTILVMNEYQYQAKDNYWANEANRWGFTLAYKTKNTIGSVNYVYIRNPNEVAIKEGEH